MSSVVDDCATSGIDANGVRAPFAPLTETSMELFVIGFTVIVSPALRTRREMRDPAERLRRATFFTGARTAVSLEVTEMSDDERSVLPRSSWARFPVT